MPSISFEKLIQSISPEEYLVPEKREQQQHTIRQFLQSFRLRDNLLEQLLQPINEYACHLETTHSFFYQYPLNQDFETEYQIHTLSLPDKITFLVKGPCGDPILIPFHQQCMENNVKKTVLGLHGADSFTRLEDGSYIASGKIEDNDLNQSPVFHITNHQSIPVTLTQQAKEYLKKLKITNLYGFFLNGNRIIFGTWGQQSNARLMEGQFQNNTLDQLVDITPDPIREKGYDDLFVRHIKNKWFQIGTKLGITTTDPAVYFVNVESNEFFTIVLNLQPTELALNYKYPKEYIRHSYTHQFYDMGGNRFATITSGRLGSVLRIIDQDGNIYAKYFINLPNDFTPFAEYAWLHVLKHPNSAFLYIPDNDEIIHRFHYNKKTNTLFVLKFRLPISGEITAITATSYGFCAALSCNNRNIILKVTEELSCFKVYESEISDTPFSILHVHEETITAVTGGRFYPFYNLSRYCHYIKTRATKLSEIVSITTTMIENDRLLARNETRDRQITFLDAFLNIYPNNYETIISLAALELERHNYHRCISFCMRAIKLEKNALLPYRLLSKSRAALHQYADALQAIARYLRDAPEDQEMLDLQIHCSKSLSPK